ncbi:MAG TPA: alpha-amylase, partial [Spirochaetales bacterium]|nr:alpha-amylase [Spirochaetales bacterium]
DRFFVTRPLDYDASSVLRPRTHPLITPMTLDDGRTVGLWTTFSADQVDLEFSEPAVFAEFIDIILGYAERGARMLRLDAIAYLWKRDGTSCAHLPETHAVVRAVRAVVDGLGLGMAVLTETNVPHEENLSYFGGFPLIGSGSGGDDSGDEAHMVYNFSLPPLVLHAFATGDAGPLSSWAASLRVPPGGVMLNFLASHDGVGVTPARGLVDDLGPLVRAVRERGGLVSYKATQDGPAPYELNVSWADAVAAPGADESERAAALVASYAIACAMDGVPAVYFHSAIGSRNWTGGPALLGHNRAINRERPRLDELEAALDSPASTRALALAGLSSLLRERALRPAFSPTSPRRGYPAQGPVFIVERGTADEATLAVVNCSRREAPVALPSGWAGAEAFDPVAGVRVPIPAAAAVSLKGYSVLWLHRR